MKIQPISSKKANLQHLEIGVLPIRVWSEVVDNLAAEPSLAEFFIDMYICELFLAERKLVLWHWQPVDIVVSTAKIAFSVTVSAHINSRTSFESVARGIYHTVVAAKADKLLPHAHNPVLVRKVCSGMRVVNPINDSARRAPPHVVREIEKVVSDRSFHVSLKICERNWYTYRGAWS